VRYRTHIVYFAFREIHLGYKLFQTAIPSRPTQDHFPPPYTHHTSPGRSPTSQTLENAGHDKQLYQPQVFLFRTVNLLGLLYKDHQWNTTHTLRGTRVVRPVLSRFCQSFSPQATGKCSHSNCFLSRYGGLSPSLVQTAPGNFTLSWVLPNSAPHHTTLSKRACVCDHHTTLVLLAQL